MDIESQKPDRAAPLVLPDVVAFHIDPGGGARPLDPQAIIDGLPTTAEPPAPGFCWVHLRRDEPDARAWLERNELDRFVLDALLTQDTRPRTTVHGDGAIVILRGVNLNPGAEPEDMVSVRFWVEAGAVVGVWIRPLRAVADLIDGIKHGRSPVSPGDLIAKLALRLADRAEPTVAALNEQIDALEERVLDAGQATLHGELAEIRRTAIGIRRFMIPQRDALTTLEIEDLPWLGQTDRSRLREAAESVTRLGEELDAIRDRASIVHDQILEARSEKMNRQMLVLSVVAAKFLPLGLITGLLGINVGGSRWGVRPYGFTLIAVGLVVLGVLELWLFKQLKLL
jgi:zinc transporter